MGVLIDSQEKFKKKVFDKYGDKVEILSEYKGSLENVDFVYHCDKHGDTYNTYHGKNIIGKQFSPCKECTRTQRSNASKGWNQQDKDFYYNKLKIKVEGKGGKLLTKEWTKAKDNYDFICENGHNFTTTADCINSKDQWCPICSGREGDFNERYKNIIEDKNGEMISDYVNGSTHIQVRCKEHNYIWGVYPANLLKGRWCPICRLPYSEKVVYDYLTNEKFNFKIQYTFDDLVGKNGELLKFDFGILDNNGRLLWLLEVDDEQHRYNLKTKAKVEGQERDKIKDKYCKENNISLFRMEYHTTSKLFRPYEKYYTYINNQIHNFLNTFYKTAI